MQITDREILRERLKMFTAFPGSLARTTIKIAFLKLGLRWLTQAGHCTPVKLINRYFKENGRKDVDSRIARRASPRRPRFQCFGKSVVPVRHALCDPTDAELPLCSRKLGEQFLHHSNIFGQTKLLISANISFVKAI